MIKVKDMLKVLVIDIFIIQMINGIMTYGVIQVDNFIWYGTLLACMVSIENPTSAKVMYIASVASSVVFYLYNGFTLSSAISCSGVGIKMVLVWELICGAISLFYKGDIKEKVIEHKNVANRILLAVAILLHIGILIAFGGLGLMLVFMMSIEVFRTIIALAIFMGTGLLNRWLIAYTVSYIGVLVTSYNILDTNALEAGLAIICLIACIVYTKEKRKEGSTYSIKSVIEESINICNEH